VREDWDVRGMEFCNTWLNVLPGFLRPYILGDRLDLGGNFIAVSV
jgi:hypothetical protein